MGHSQLPASERLEREVLQAMHDGASADTRTRLGLRATEIAGTLVSVAAHDPAIMLNRAIGLGLTEPASAAAIAAVRECYQTAGIERFFLHRHPDAKPEGLDRLLADAGLVSYRRWVKFTRGTAAPPQAETGLTIREIGPEHADAFGRIVAAGFDLSPDAAALFNGLVGRDGFHLYMAFDGERPASTGLLCIDGRDAWFDWGATDPDQRGRGAQRALLARRIDDAITAGCTRLMTCTGEEVPGDPQHSYHNIEWAGFRPEYLRENWIPA